MKIGDVIEYRGYRWILLDKHYNGGYLFLSEMPVGYHRFDPKSTDFETSELYSWLCGTIDPRIRTKDLLERPFVLSEAQYDQYKQTIISADKVYSPWWLSTPAEETKIMKTIMDDRFTCAHISSVTVAVRAAIVLKVDDPDLEETEEEVSEDDFIYNPEVDHAVTAVSDMDEMLAAEPAEEPEPVTVEG